MTLTNRLHQIPKPFFIFKRRVSSLKKSPQAIFIGKTIEEPIIVLREENNIDLIGPPDALSNLRPIIREIIKNETVLQRKYREAADATQKWNQEFWQKHNKNFFTKKEIFVKKHTSEAKPNLNADEMSEFYKTFLNKNWQTHVAYNFEWYGRNFHLLMLSLRVHLEHLRSKIL
ncbi:unnamed protein product [Ceutorhynchus assimilis]|uniref:APOPT family protein CG14806, mitochondrial n=1 Tax=Ceutorhynchus assimilis TaxID=467358 RepID=A0A9N9QMV4_9CUCU|nr:unnamed protein product [Ceutorhynchus assimilis]